MRDDIPETSGTDLSTDDIARSRERDTAPETDRDPTTREARSAPVYPGEATSTVGLGSEENAEGEEREMSEERGQREGAGEREQGGGEDEFRLMDPGDADEFRSRWHELQSLFVDDPRRAVKEADELVAAVMQKLAGSFSAHRKRLEGQWREGEDVDTEQLRTALRHYRAFFHRLLSTERAGGDRPGGDRPGGDLPDGGRPGGRQLDADRGDTH
ncbi:hypothetical protein ACH414_17435 [Streptomyces sp. NPDC020422]|uniref:hypothetical protein n=1 Tax=Streptomyces sp. NPDC020422 TaxID=3365074 RepID=UPI00379436C2